MPTVKRSGLSRSPTDVVNRSFTISQRKFQVERSAALCHSPMMADQSPRPRSGGFFLMAAILIGAGWGIDGRDPMKGVLVGTAIGVAIVALIWVADRVGRR